MFSQMHFPLSLTAVEVAKQKREEEGLGRGPEMSSGEQRRAAELCDFGFMQCC